MDTNSRYIINKRDITNSKQKKKNSFRLDLYEKLTKELRFQA